MTSLRLIFTMVTIMTVALSVFTSAAVVDVMKNFKVCTCTKDFSPVCASNGLTYPNRCVFNCNNEKGDLQVRHEGPCTVFTLELFGSTCTRKCNHLKRPVCGTDGFTYENPCMFKCAQLANPKLKMKHVGAC